VPGKRSTATRNQARDWRKGVTRRQLKRVALVGAKRPSTRLTRDNLEEDQRITPLSPRIALSVLHVAFLK